MTVRLLSLSLALLLSVAGGVDQLGLWNLAAQCAQVDKRDWKALIAEHLDVVLSREDQDAEREAAFAQGLDAVRPHLRATLWPTRDMPPEVLEDLASVPITDGLIAAIAWDSAMSVTTLNASDIEDLGLSPAEALEIAVDNHGGDAISVQWVALPQQEHVQVVMVETPDPYAATHALRLDSLREGDPPAGGWLVAVPLRSFLVAVPIDHAGAIEALNVMVPVAREAYGQGPRSVTPEVYWLSEGAWRPIGVQLEADGRVGVHPPPGLVEVLEGLAGPVEPGATSSE